MRGACVVTLPVDTQTNIPGRWTERPNLSYLTGKCSPWKTCVEVQWVSQVALVVKSPPANVGDKGQGFGPWVWKIPWGRAPQPTLVLPGESHGQRSLAGYSSPGCKESESTERLNTLSGGGSVVKNLPASAGDPRDKSSIPGLGRSLWEGNSNPLQYSCLENLIEEPDVLQSMEHTHAYHHLL